MSTFDYNKWHRDDAYLLEEARKMSNETADYFRKVRSDVNRGQYDSRLYSSDVKLAAGREVVAFIEKHKIPFSSGMKYFENAANGSGVAP